MLLSAAATRREIIGLARENHGVLLLYASVDLAGRL